MLPIVSTTLNDLKAEVRETHISLLFFVGDRVYKFRKPVRLEFVDFTDPIARTEDCLREIDVNRRLAPDVYLGVGTVAQPDGTAEPMVVMKRLPDGRSLAAMIRSGTDVSSGIDAIAHVLAAFHSTTTRSRRISSGATPEALRRIWSQLFAAAANRSERGIDLVLAGDVGRIATQYMEGRRKLFEERIAGGRVCDGHGDIQASEVFLLDDGPRILDSIEFDDRLRHVDGVADLAFLVMDLEHLGAGDLGERLVARYRELTGDTFPVSLLHFYVAQRAFVRAVVAASAGSRSPAGDATSFERLALRHLGLGQVRLVLVGGLPGTGKSTIAEGLAVKIGGTLLSTDEVRREMMDDPNGTRPEQRYEPEAIRDVYDRVMSRAKTALERGISVVLDGSWSDGTLRYAARMMSRDTNSSLTEIVCDCPAGEADHRILLREQRGDSISEATTTVRAAMERRFADWPEAEVIDTSQTVAASLEQASKLVEMVWLPAPSEVATALPR